MRTSQRRPPGAPRPKTANQAARLSGAGAFEAVFRHGTRREGRHVQIILAPAAAGSGRVGFIVGRKALARAVDRNRLKRVLRERLRARRPKLAAFDLVIRVKQPVPRPLLADVAAEAIRLVDEAVTAASRTAA